jgi:hypothetical protein
MTRLYDRIGRDRDASRESLRILTRNHEAALIRIMELESQMTRMLEAVDALQQESSTVADLRGDRK